jgi:hypothetical protein
VDHTQTFNFFTGISTSSFYRVVWRTIRAIVRCKQLSIRFPKTVEGANAAAGSFASVSDQQCIFNCVAAVDVYLLHCPRKMPRMSHNYSLGNTNHFAGGFLPVDMGWPLSDTSLMSIYSFMWGLVSRRNKTYLVG